MEKYMPKIYISEYHAKVKRNNKGCYQKFKVICCHDKRSQEIL